MEHLTHPTSTTPLLRQNRGDFEAENHGSFFSRIKGLFASVANCFIRAKDKISTFVYEYKQADNTQTGARMFYKINRIFNHVVEETWMTAGTATSLTPDTTTKTSRNSSAENPLYRNLFKKQLNTFFGDFNNAEALSQSFMDIFHLEDGTSTDLNQYNFNCTDSKENIVILPALKTPLYLKDKTSINIVNNLTTDTRTITFDPKDAPKNGNVSLKSIELLPFKESYRLKITTEETAFIGKKSKSYFALPDALIKQTTKQS